VDESELDHVINLRERVATFRSENIEDRGEKQKNVDIYWWGSRISRVLLVFQ
jgi:hypothetical protein